MFTAHARSRWRDFRHGSHPLFLFSRCSVRFDIINRSSTIKGSAVFSQSLGQLGQKRNIFFVQAGHINSAVIFYAKQVVCRYGNNRARSTRLGGDGIKSPCSHELIPFRVIFILRASSTCVHPRASRKALIRSAVMLPSPLFMSSIAAFSDEPLSLGSTT